MEPIAFLIVVFIIFGWLPSWLHFRKMRRDAFAKYLVEADLVISRMKAEEWISAGYIGQKAEIDFDASWATFKTTYFWDYDFTKMVIVKGLKHAAK
jgi:hypothetical protein